VYAMMRASTSGMRSGNCAHASPVSGPHETDDSRLNCKRLPLGRDNDERCFTDMNEARGRAMAPVITVNRDDLLGRRAKILREFRLDERGFEPVEHERELTNDEWLARDTLEAVEFLLDEDA
jgi:hypothetical protein